MSRKNINHQYSRKRGSSQLNPCLQRVTQGSCGLAENHKILRYGPSQGQHQHCLLVTHALPEHPRRPHVTPLIRRRSTGIEELTRQLVWRLASACTCQACSTAVSTVCLHDRKRHFALVCRLESLAFAGIVDPRGYLQVARYFRSENDCKHLAEVLYHSNSSSMAANGHANVNGTHEMADDTFLFTSESVNEGHPDKLCDQV